MKKLILLVFLLAPAVCMAMGEQARNLELIDVPTANTLVKGEVNYDAKFYEGGGILNRIYVGVFDRLMIGCGLNIENLIGEGNVSVDLPPTFAGRIRLTDDRDSIPAITIGYEGEGYMDSPAKGAFLALTKEISMGGAFLQLTGDAYTNEFTHFGKDINFAAGLAAAITRDFVISSEYDGILEKDYSHINAGVAYFFDPIEISIDVKYGLGRDDVKLARVLNIKYINYF